MRDGFPGRSFAREKALRTVHAVNERAGDWNRENEKTPKRAVATPYRWSPDEVLDAEPGQHVVRTGNKEQERDQDRPLPAHALWLRQVIGDRPALVAGFAHLDRIPDIAARGLGVAGHLDLSSFIQLIAHIGSR